MLAEILAYIEAQLTGITCSTGANSIPEKAMPPRLVWVPTADTIGPKDGSGDTETLTAVLTREATVEAHIWGVSHAQAEAMLHNVLSAFVRVASIPNLKFGQAKWVDAEAMHFGMAVILPITISIPVYSAPITLPSSSTGTCDPPTGDVQLVTIVTGTPGASEANLVLATFSYD